MPEGASSHASSRENPSIAAQATPKSDVADARQISARRRQRQDYARFAFRHVPGYRLGGDEMRLGIGDDRESKVVER